MYQILESVNETKYRKLFLESWAELLTVTALSILSTMAIRTFRKDKTFPQIDYPNLLISRLNWTTHWCEHFEQTNNSVTGN